MKTSSKLWTSGSGIFLILLALGVTVLDSSNFLAFGLALFVLLIGIMVGYDEVSRWTRDELERTTSGGTRNRDNSRSH